MIFKNNVLYGMYMYKYLEMNNI